MSKKDSFYNVFLPIVKSYNYFQISYDGGGYSSIDEKGKESIPELFKDDMCFKFLDAIPNEEKQQVAEDLGNLIYRYNKANRIKQYGDKKIIPLHYINRAISKDLKIVQKFKELMSEATYNYYITGEYKETGKPQILSFVEEMERELREKDFGGLIGKNRYYKEVPIPHSTKEELKADLQKLFENYKLSKLQDSINILVESLQILNP